MRSRLFGFVIILILAISVNASLQWYARRFERRKAIESVSNVTIPPSIDRSKIPFVHEGIASSSSSKPIKIRDEVNWNVPFTSQAPLGQWDSAHEEACEEASVLMVLRYFNDQVISFPQSAEKSIQGLIRQNADTLGFPVSQTVQQVAALIALNDKNHLLKISVKSYPTVDSIRKDLSAGRLIILPAFGRALGNPYYREPGPLYHMLVIRGYTKDGFVVTNDPGTKRGENYPYTFDTLLKANHDWNNGDTEHGLPAVIVVGKYPVFRKAAK